MNAEQAPIPIVPAAWDPSPSGVRIRDVRVIRTAPKPRESKTEDQQQSPKDANVQS